MKEKSKVAEKNRDDKENVFICEIHAYHEVR